MPRYSVALPSILAEAESPQEAAELVAVYLASLRYQDTVRLSVTDINDPDQTEHTVFVSTGGLPNPVILSSPKRYRGVEIVDIRHPTMKSTHISEDEKHPDSSSRE